MWKPLHPSTVFSLAMCMCAGGCALTAEQKAAVMRFSEATIAFTDLASQEFVQSRADVVEMNKLRNQLDRAGGLKPRVEGEELDGALTLERVRERKEAMAALREYAELLETLTTSSNAAEIRAAAESFTASLKGLGRLSISDSKAASVTSILEHLGLSIVESMRRNAVIDTVQFAHPYILSVVELVKRDLDPEGEHWSLAYDATAEGLRVSANGALTLATTGETASPSGSDTVSLAFIQGCLDTAASYQERFRVVSDRLLAAAGDLCTAHEDLQVVVTDESVQVGSIQAFLDSVDEFVGAFATLRVHE